jgi:hypothetical protein
MARMKHFKLKEFECKCGCESNEMDIEFLQMLVRARKTANIPFKITSGFRCEQHPLSIKSPTSSHIKGIASDIAFGNGTDLAIIMGALVGADFERFGIHFDKHFLHVDSDKNKTFPIIWGY